MCALLQIYQCPVASNQNLTSVSSTWSHKFINFPRARTCPCLKMLSFGRGRGGGGIKVLLGAFSHFNWGRRRPMMDYTCCLWLVTHSMNSWENWLCGWLLGMLGESQAVIILQFSSASAFLENSFSIFKVNWPVWWPIDGQSIDCQVSCKHFTFKQNSKHTWQAAASRTCTSETEQTGCNLLSSQVHAILCEEAWSTYY